MGLVLSFTAFFMTVPGFSVLPQFLAFPKTHRSVHAGLEEQCSHSWHGWYYLYQKSVFQ